MNPSCLPALAEAAQSANHNTIFQLLSIGDIFKFSKTDAQAFVKTASGYKSIEGGHTWKTSARAAVYRVQP